jgi:hypothetical protein
MVNQLTDNVNQNPSIRAELPLPLENLIQLKLLKGISYTDMARLSGLGFSGEYFRAALKGRLIPSVASKKAIGDMLGVDPLRVTWGITNDQKDGDDDESRG